eukprot:s1389_g2.t1
MADLDLIDPLKVELEEPKEAPAWMIAVADFAGCGTCCMLLDSSWAAAALRASTALALASGAPRGAALRAIQRRPFLEVVDASRCAALHEDVAVQGLSSLLRRLPGKATPRPRLRPGDLPLRCLRLSGARGLGRPSVVALQRLGLEHFAFPAARAERGTVLLSRPLFPGAGCEPEMVRSVILLLSHTKGGSVGLALNKHCKLDLEDLIWTTAPTATDLSSQPVAYGGSFGSGLFLLHAQPSEAELEGEELLPGVFVSSDEKVFARAKDLVRWKRLHPSELCLFFGCCRWQPGELDAALRDGFFSAVHCDPRFLSPPLAEPAELWAELTMQTMA